MALKRSLPERWINGLTKCVSGGIASCGWASSIIRSSVVPERPTPTTNGAGKSGSERPRRRRLRSMSKRVVETIAAQDHVVAELAQQGARLGLERRSVVGAHLTRARPPCARRPGGARRARARPGARRPSGRGVRPRPARSPSSATRSPEPPVVVEHRGVEVELDQLADAAQLGLGVGDEVLVAQLQVAAAEPLRLARGRPRCAGARGAPCRPSACRRPSRVAAATARRRARRGSGARSAPRRAARRSRSSSARRRASSRPSAACRRARRRARRRRAGPRPRRPSSSRRDPLAKPALVEAEVAPGPRADDRSTNPSALAPASRGLDQLRHEVGLGRDRQLGVGVEHQPQQRRARATDADDERGRGGLAAGGRGHAGAGAAEILRLRASESNRARPSVEPVSASTACSGCGIRPTTLPASLQTPAMSATEPFGFCPGA